MSWNIEVEGGKSVRLPTAGKYCDQDIVVAAKSDEDFDKLIDGSLKSVSSNTQYIRSNMFRGAVVLKSVNFPQASSAGSYAFCDSGITEAVFPKLYLGSICIFQGAESLTKISFPRTPFVGAQCFQFCTALTDIDLPACTQLLQYAFDGCSMLAFVDLPLVDSIARCVFRSCSALTTVILRSTTMTTLENTDAFSNTPIADGTGYIYVPAALVDTYKADSNWSVYANQIRAIEDYTVDGTVTGVLDFAKMGIDMG